MKSIHIILATTATAGTVAIGGGAFAMAGGHQEAAPPATPGVPAAAPKVSTPALPDPANCVSASAVDVSQLPAELRSKVDAAKVKAQLEAERLKSKVPANAPSTLPTNVPAAPNAKGAAKAANPQSVKAAAAEAARRLQAGVPLCAPQTYAQGVPTAPPAGAPVEAPAAPTLPKFSCDSVAPVVKAGSTVEHAITTPDGLRFVSTKSRTITLKGKKICRKTQKWTNKGGQSLTVERLKGEASMDQLRQALRLPQAQPVTLGKDTYWQSPVMPGQGGGIMWSPAPGVVVFVSGSPELQQYRLQQIAAQLHQAG